MLIHQSLAGCVIGKGGSKIKEIRDVSKIITLFFLCCLNSKIIYSGNLLHPINIMKTSHHEINEILSKERIFHFESIDCYYPSAK